MVDATGALDSLLGRLTAVLASEAQLLGGVRSDVEFIKDEMESMNGLLLPLTEAQHRDHQVRAWMKQVAGLTRDCEGNVELYIHYVGGGPGGDDLLGCLRRIPRFLRTVLARHRIATRIRELKVRARDVGDRRQRYGVTVPPASAAAGGADTYCFDIEPAAGDEQDLGRRAVLLDCAEEPPLDDEEVVRKGVDTLIKWLCSERAPAPAAAATRDHGEPQVRLFCITGYYLSNKVADGVYKHPSVATLFGYKMILLCGQDARASLAFILEHSSKEGERSRERSGVQPGKENEEEEQLVRKLQGHLKLNRFLIVASRGSLKKQEWERFLDGLFHAAEGCHPGSAIVINTWGDQVALSSSPYKIIIRTQPPPSFYTGHEKTEWSRTNYKRRHFYLTGAAHLGAKENKGKDRTIAGVIEECDPNAFAMKTFLHLLQVNPNRTQDELQKYSSAILECKRLNKSISKQLLMWCYNELPSKYRSCVYPKDHIMRTTSLARRWVAEGFITTTSSNEKQSATDEAEHCLDVLFVRGFVSPVEISAAGDIKSCTLHHEVQEFIAKIARDVNFVDASQPTHLAHHLSIHNRIAHPQGDSKGIASSLPSLAASPQWQLLKVLDLEASKGLDKKHLKSICKILLLKYLSLRNTDVTELPKQIKKLQCLETLDIRQTKVRKLPKKAIVLPLLKHFLAGHKGSARGDNTTPEESISTVSIPLYIQRMKNIEILSHVRVANSESELAGITQLLKLWKLGVALQGKTIKLSDLFDQIEKLHKCLRSLSIRMGCPVGSENHDAGEVDALPSLPQFIERLNISGVGSGLSRLIQEYHQLAKVTLSTNNFKEDVLRILGMLRGLRCLRLLHKSYIESDSEVSTICLSMAKTSQILALLLAGLLSSRGLCGPLPPLRLFLVSTTSLS